MGKVQLRLKELIEERRAQGQDITQESLAYEIKVAQGTLSRWVGNRIDSVNLAILNKLCDYFDVEVGEIVVRVKDKK